MSFTLNLFLFISINVKILFCIKDFYFKKKFMIYIYIFFRVSEYTVYNAMHQVMKEPTTSTRHWPTRRQADEWSCNTSPISLISSWPSVTESKVRNFWTCTKWRYGPETPEWVYNQTSTPCLELWKTEKENLLRRHQLTREIIQL